ncbi:GHMP family kinase ATP-binding protein [Pelosinus baikalensis]|uniref:GHMP kinase n=1 Tax=Pelosinus baikalensis TaxID=2892015 RepID=A0ABS8HMZ7_9FIRM|nr:GHMP kinase [Pelosinus baikalensis]MCC5464425.1 GHMP kinase [Pelosinus baikalensis]
MRITVKAPGSCGELAQGTIAGRNFLITCPIDLYSEVTVKPCEGTASLNVGNKVMSAIEKTLHYLQITDNFYVNLRSELPIGKGMASSSADISATCQSIALSTGKILSPDEIADIALSIEPTDGIFYPGIVLFDHIQGHIRQCLGNAIPMYIAIFDVGGEIDTLYFNQRNDLEKLNQAKELQVQEAMNLIVKGLTTNDLSLLGKGATLSALANQKILFKPYLEEMISISLSWGAVGVNIAHSGTVVGVLFPPNQLQHCSPCIEEINRHCNGVKFLRIVKFISGGLMKQEGDSNEWNQCF